MSFGGLWSQSLVALNPDVLLVTSVLISLSVSAGQEREGIRHYRDPGLNSFPGEM